MLGTILCIVDGFTFGKCDGTLIGYFKGFIGGTEDAKFEGLLLGA